MYKAVHIEVRVSNATDQKYESLYLTTIRRDFSDAMTKEEVEEWVMLQMQNLLSEMSLKWNHRTRPLPIPDEESF